MAYATVEIDMADMETSDLVFEVCKRLEREGTRKSLNTQQKGRLKEKFALLGEHLLIMPFESIDVKTLDDKMKYEHLAGVFNKYTVEQIEKLLP